MAIGRYDPSPQPLSHCGGRGASRLVVPPRLLGGSEGYTIPHPNPSPTAAGEGLLDWWFPSPRVRERELGGEEKKFTANLMST